MPHGARVRPRDVHDMIHRRGHTEHELPLHDKLMSSSEEGGQTG